MSRTATSQEAPTRKKRTPISGRNVLTVVGKEPGYVYRIVNDTGDRIAQFLEADYELVEASAVQVGDRRVNNGTAEGTKAQVSVGGGSKAFVMRIKEEFYKEDQVAKHAHVNQLEQTIKQTSGKADFGELKISTGRPD